MYDIVEIQCGTANSEVKLLLLTWSSGKENMY